MMSSKIVELKIKLSDFIELRIRYFDAYNCN